jgi:hypothetical protein
MPFRIRHRPSKGDQEPELVPTPVCDYCGEPIAHVRDGVWLIAPDQYETKDGPVLVAHHDRWMIGEIRWFVVTQNSIGGRIRRVGIPLGGSSSGG